MACIFFYIIAIFSGEVKHWRTIWLAEICMSGAVDMYQLFVVYDFAKPLSVQAETDLHVVM